MNWWRWSERDISWYILCSCISIHLNHLRHHPATAGYLLAFSRGRCCGLVAAGCSTLGAERYFVRGIRSFLLGGANTQHIRDILDVWYYMIYSSNSGWFAFNGALFGVWIWWWIWWPVFFRWNEVFVEEALAYKPGTVTSNNQDMTCVQNHTFDLTWLGPLGNQFNSFTLYCNIKVLFF